MAVWGGRFEVLGVNNQAVKGMTVVVKGEKDDDKVCDVAIISWALPAMAFSIVWRFEQVVQVLWGSKLELHMDVRFRHLTLNPLKSQSSRIEPD